MYPFIVTKRSSSSFSPLTASHQFFLTFSSWEFLRGTADSTTSPWEHHWGPRRGSGTTLSDSWGCRSQPCHRTRPGSRAVRQTDKQTDRRRDRLINKLTDRETDRLINKLTDGLINKLTDGETDRLINELTDGGTDKLIDELTDRQTEWETDVQR